MIKNNLRTNLLTYIAYCLPGRSFSYEKCQKDLESVGVVTTIPTLRKEFSLCKTEKFIDFKTHYRKPFPVLSPKGRLEIKIKLPFRRYGDFNGTWKIVIFDIPERMRNQRLTFHKELINLGFGRISRGVYISPHPLFSTVKRIAKKLVLENHVTYLRTDSIEEEKRTVARAWNLNNLNEKYEKFILDAKYLSFERRPFWPIYAKSLEKSFAILYSRDPQLPEDYSPHLWKGKEAYGIFKAVSNSY